MSRIYDGWERLVGATLEREQLRALARANSMDSSSSAGSDYDPPFDFPLRDNEQAEIFKLRASLSSDQWNVSDILATEGALEALVELIKEPLVSFGLKRSSLLAISHIILSPSWTRFFPGKAAGTYSAEVGLVAVLLKTIILYQETKRSLSECALGVLDGVCSCGEGRKATSENALATPVLVKGMLRISEVADGFAVLVLWRLAGDEEGGKEVIAEATEVGGFNRLVVLLEWGCSEATGRYATELLNLCRNFGPQCVL